MLLLVLVLLVVDDLGIFDHIVGVAPVRARGGALLLLLDLLDVAAGESLLRLLYGLLYPELGIRVNLAVHVIQGALDGVDEVIGVVANVGLLAPALILLGVRLGVPDHLLDLRVGEAAGGRDRDPLLFACPEILRTDVDDAVRVYVERDLDLGHAPRRGRNAHELEVADELVVRRHLPLTLVDLDLDRALIVVGGREDLALARGYGRVPLDELRHHPALSLNLEGEWRDVE